jgi:hypothetical protein
VNIGVVKEGGTDDVKEAADGPENGGSRRTKNGQEAMLDPAGERK